MIAHVYMKGVEPNIVEEGGGGRGLRKVRGDGYQMVFINV